MPHAPIVEVDWPNSGTWTDVTRYVRDESGIVITRGRGDEQSDIQPGTMSLTFHNDGRFTPGLASGAYYPNVRKNRPIRCRLVRWTKNMVTNSSFETDTAGWGTGGSAPPSIAVSTAQAWSGTKSMLATWGAGGALPLVETTVYGFEIGEVYTASAYVRVPSGGSPAVLLAVAGGALSNASTMTNAWQRITLTFTATNTFHTLQMWPATSPAASHQVWVDAVQVERGAPASAYSRADATISTRFVGRVNEWPVEWTEGATLALSDVTCTDVFKRLGGLDPMRSLLEEEMLYLQPDAYYTLGDEADSTSAGDTSGKGQQSMRTYQVSGAGGVVSFGAEDGPSVDALPAPRFTPFSFTQGKGLRADLKPATGSLVIACWIKTTVPGRDFLQVCSRYGGIGGAAVVLNVDAADGTLRVAAFLGEDLVSGDFGNSPGITTNLADGKDHLVAVLLKSDGGVFASVDGNVGANGFSYGSIIQPDLYDRLVAGGFQSPDGTSNLFDGVLSHVWYARRTTQPDWSWAYSAGSGVTESTADRFNRVRGLLKLWGVIRGSSTTQISAQAAGGVVPLQALRDIAAVEAGLVYASRSAAETVIFECRNWRYNRAPAVTLTAAEIWEGLRWSDDDQPIENDVTNRREGGADQRVTNQASIADYGIYTGGSSQPWASDADALADAQWRVYKGADPPPRVTQVTVAASTLASYAAVLDLDISDVVRLTGLPAPSPQATVDLHIEGYSETISLVLHTITYNTGPAAPNQVWQLGVPGRSELGVTTRFAL
ncbi:carbohydrate binding domain-containing protein [Microtetraspora malaysiensis]|uniref:carbohydrate binding domain-containing protein n=1 Tax=Microtetraspora malaysiensis TaxID=161358 RepID=UPI003D9349E1